MNFVSWTYEVPRGSVPNQAQHSGQHAEFRFVLGPTHGDIGSFGQVFQKRSRVRRTAMLNILWVIERKCFSLEVRPVIFKVCCKSIVTCVVCVGLCLLLLKLCENQQPRCGVFDFVFRPPHSSSFHPATVCFRPGTVPQIRDT